MGTMGFVCVSAEGPSVGLASTKVEGGAFPEPLVRISAVFDVVRLVYCVGSRGMLKVEVPNRRFALHHGQNCHCIAIYPMNTGLIRYGVPVWNRTGQIIVGQGPLRAADADEQSSSDGLIVTGRKEQGALSTL